MAIEKKNKYTINMSIGASKMITDYIVFIIFIFLSTICPIWHDRHTKTESSTKQNYVFAKGRVSMFAVMLSIARGMCGVQGFIGYPSELFYRGIGMWETLYGLLSAYIIVCFLFAPVYCSTDLTSIYQYLEMRLVFLSSIFWKGLEKICRIYHVTSYFYDNFFILQWLSFEKNS